MLNFRNNFYKRDYWITRNLSYAHPHFRLEKCGRIINAIAAKRTCDLLDLGCGPAALAKLLNKNINYYGIDIAIQKPAPNLLELDLLDSAINFQNKRFDIVVASGVFEYMGDRQRQKFSEIDKILRENGKFIVTYSNIGHRAWKPEQPWNNFQTINEFKRDLQLYFRIDRFFASSHNRRCHASTNWFTKNLQLRLNCFVPWVSQVLAVEYFMICSKRNAI